MVWGLQFETLVGLPRSNLVKKPDIVVPPVGAVVTGPSLPLPAVSLAGDLSSDMSRATDPGIDVEVPVEVKAPPVVAPSMRAAAPSIVEPSAQSLLERAAALGPVRLTFESIAIPDPVLEAKHEPRIAERRARLTRVVKATLGACVGVCILAVGVSIFSSSEAQAAPRPMAGKTTPNEVVKSVEPLAGGMRGKAVKAPPATALREASAARPIARPLKRR